MPPQHAVLLTICVPFVSVQVFGWWAALCATALYASTSLSLTTASCATYSERFPRVNSEEMWQAVVVLWAAEAARGLQLAYAHRLQVRDSATQ